MLHGKQHSVVVLRAAKYVLGHPSDAPALRRVDLGQLPAQVRIREGRTGTSYYSSVRQRAVGARKVERRIERYLRPQVGCLTSQVARGQQPGLRKLPLDCQVPR